MVASESKWVNSDYIWYLVNLLRGRGLQMRIQHKKNYFWKIVLALNRDFETKIIFRWHFFYKERFSPEKEPFFISIHVILIIILF